MKVETFVYYGIVAEKENLEHFAQMSKIKNIYDLIFGNKLSYRELGDVSKSKKIVIGKELFWDYGENIIEVEKINDKIKLFSNVSKYEINEPNESIIEIDKKDINNKLLKLGLVDEPKIYIFNSWLN